MSESHPHMKTHEYTLAMDLHYYNARSGKFSPKTIHLDHYKTFDEAFIALRTTAPDHYNINTAEKTWLRYLISDATIIANRTEQIAARLMKQPRTKGITDTRSSLYQETVWIEGGLSFMGETLRNVTMKEHKNAANNHFLVGIYNGARREMMAAYPKYKNNIAELNDAHFKGNHFYYYHCSGEVPRNLTSGDTTNLVAQEQSFHCSSISQAFNCMLLTLLGQPGTDRKLSRDSLPEYNAIICADNHDAIAGINFTRCSKSVLLAEKALHLRLTKEIPFVASVYEISGLRKLKKDDEDLNFKIATLACDNDTILPTRKAIALRESLLNSETRGKKSKQPCFRQNRPDIGRYKIKR